MQSSSSTKSGNDNLQSSAWKKFAFFTFQFFSEEWKKSSSSSPPDKSCFPCIFLKTSREPHSLFCINMMGQETNRRGKRKPIQIIWPETQSLVICALAVLAFSSEPIWTFAPGPGIAKQDTFRNAFLMPLPAFATSAEVSASDTCKKTCLKMLEHIQSSSELTV